MQAAQKKQVILRLMAVGGPVLLTFILLLMAVSQFYGQREPKAFSAAVDKKLVGINEEGDQSASALPTIITSKARDKEVRHLGSPKLNPYVTQPSEAQQRIRAKRPSQALQHSQPQQGRQAQQQGPLLAPPTGFVNRDMAQRVPTQPVSMKRPGFNIVRNAQQGQSQQRQPLSDALEAMVNKESIDPLGDDLFLNTTSLEKLNQQLIPEVRSGFNLGKSGAIYAAREQFIYVLRRVAVAKDAKEQSDRHMKALAQGLRALDEADDFIPHGDSIEAELDVMTISVSHATPVINQHSGRRSVVYDEITPEMLTPHQASAEYARYAAKQLSEALAEEKAGSMALYGLGKTFARLEAQTKLQAHPKDSTAGLKCNVMYRAAVLAHPANYLAANELGVRLAKAGRYESARKVLQMAARQPANATVFENLAAVEQKMGNMAQAEQIRRAGHQIAMRERMHSEISRRHGVSWVSPDEFRNSGPSSQANPPAIQTPPIASQQANQVSAEEPTQGSWKTAFNYVRKATGWNKENSSPVQESGPVQPQYNTQLARRPSSIGSVPTRTANLPSAQFNGQPLNGQPQGYYPQYR